MNSCASAMSRSTRAVSHSMPSGTMLISGRIHMTCSPFDTLHNGGPGTRPTTTISSTGSLSAGWAPAVAWAHAASSTSNGGNGLVMCRSLVAFLSHEYTADNRRHCALEGETPDEHERFGEVGGSRGHRGLAARGACAEPGQTDRRAVRGECARCADRSRDAH